MIKVIDAILSINPSAGVQVYDNSLDRISWDEGTSKIPKEDIEAELNKLQKEYDAQAYARARKPLYPDIGDQLDDLYHKGAFSADMAAKIKKVKDDNPKG
jgi:hypothetical protein